MVKTSSCACLPPSVQQTLIMQLMPTKSVRSVHIMRMVKINRYFHSYYLTYVYMFIYQCVLLLQYLIYIYIVIYECVCHTCPISRCATDCEYSSQSVTHGESETITMQHRS